MTSGNSTASGSDAPNLQQPEGNLDQIEAWNGEQGQTWVRFADRFHSTLAPYGAILLDEAEVKPESRVLDIGCGMGETTVEAARRAYKSRVVGVDISRLFLAEARRNAEHAGTSNVEFREADAETASFEPRTYDLTISRFGVMFFSDPRAAFANLAKATKPNGKLAVMVWQPLERNEWLSEIRAILAQGRHLPEPEDGAPGPMSLGDAASAKRVLEEAGWKDPSFKSIELPYLAGVDADDAFTFLSQQSMTRSLLAELPPENQEKALHGLRTSIERHVSDGGVKYGSAAWLVQASLP